MSNRTSNFVQLTILIIFTIFSLPCCLFILYHYIRYRSFRRRFSNQTLIILVIFALLNMLFSIPTLYSFYARGDNIAHNHVYCHIWQTIDYTLTACIIWCMAFLTIERYILVFRPILLRTQRQKRWLHSFPLIIIVSYITIFYILTNVLIECDDRFDYNAVLCGSDCLDRVTGLSQFNWLFNIIFPTFIIIFGSIFLLVRVLWKRRDMQQNLRNWSKNSKMIIQLLCVSIVYMIIWIPLSILSLISTFRTVNATVTIENYFYFATYLCEMLVPVVGLLSWPEMTQKIRGRFRANSISSLSAGVYSTN